MIEYKNNYHTSLKIYYLSYLIPFTIINSFKFQTLIDEEQITKIYSKSYKPVSSIRNPQ